MKKEIRWFLCKLGLHKYQVDTEKMIAFCPYCWGKWHASYDMTYGDTIIGKKWNCNCECHYQEPYGFVPEADCPIHDSLKEAKEIAKISGKIQMPKEKPPEDWEKEYKERFAFPVSNADNPTIYYKEKWIDQRDIEIIDFIRQLLTQQKQKWDKDHELLVNAIIDTYKMKIKDLKQQYRQEILEEIEKEIKSQKIPASYEIAHYKMGLEKAKELINKDE